MANKAGVEGEVVNQLVDFLRSTPKAVGILFASFVSGHLWVFLYTAYFRKGTKGDHLIKSLTGRTAVGLLWLTAILVPFHAIRFGSIPSEYDKILELAIPTIILALFIQLLVALVAIGLRERK